eukprot:RCo009288
MNIMEKLASALDARKSGAFALDDLESNLRFSAGRAYPPVDGSGSGTGARDWHQVPWDFPLEADSGPSSSSRPLMTAADQVPELAARYPGEGREVEFYFGGTSGASADRSFPYREEDPGSAGGGGPGGVSDAIQKLLSLNEERIQRTQRAPFPNAELASTSTSASSSSSSSSFSALVDNAPFGGLFGPAHRAGRGEVAEPREAYPPPVGTSSPRSGSTLFATALESMPVLQPWQQKLQTPPSMRAVP